MSHPSQVVTNAVAALQREDWEGFITLCDPVSVRRFKSNLVWQFADHRSTEPLTVDDLLTDRPEMPREVAEYNLAEMERYRDPVERLRLEISTVSSIEELNGLNPAEVLLRWLEARTPRREDEFSIRKWEPSEGLEVVEVRRLSQDELDTGTIHRPKYLVLGSVRDGPDFAHVVCRQADSDNDEFSDEFATDASGTPPDEVELEHALRYRTMMQTVACRRQPDDSWRLIADRNLFFLAQIAIEDSGVGPG
jgi:hypothetical protein